MPSVYWKVGLEKRECKKGLTNLVITDLGLEKGRQVCKEEKKITDLGPEKGRRSVRRKNNIAI